MVDVCESGIKRHLGERVSLKKKEISYGGILDVDEMKRYFVRVESIFDMYGFGYKRCGEEKGRVYVNEPGSDVVSLFGRNYRVGAGERVDQFREFRFVSRDPIRYRVNRRKLSRGASIITERGLGSGKNWLSYCGVRKPAREGGYLDACSGILVGDKDNGFGVIHTGEGTVDIEEWDRVVLSSGSNGSSRSREYTFRKKL